MTDRAPEDLADHEAIRELWMRYARGVDGRDLDLVASCFLQDAAYEGALGRGGVADALRTLAGAFTRYEHTQHLLDTQSIEVSGDRATSDTHAIAYHVLAGSGGRDQYTVAVRYRDDLVRGNDGWRIARRKVTRDWERRETR